MSGYRHTETINMVVKCVKGKGCGRPQIKSNQNTLITRRRSQANQRRVMTMTRSDTRVHMQRKTIRLLTVV